MGGSFHWFGIQPTALTIFHVRAYTAVTTPCNSPISPCNNTITFTTYIETILVLPPLAASTGAYCTVSDDRVTQMVFDYISFESYVPGTGWSFKIQWAHPAKTKSRQSFKHVCLVLLFVTLFRIINTSYQKLPFGSGDDPDMLSFQKVLNLAV